MLYSIAKKFGLRRELKNIKEIKAEASKKLINYRSNISNSDSDYYSSLYSDRYW